MLVAVSQCTCCTQFVQKLDCVRLCTELTGSLCLLQVLNIYQKRAESLLRKAEESGDEIPEETCVGVAAKVLGMRKSLRHFETNQETLPQGFLEQLKLFEGNLLAAHKVCVACVQLVCTHPLLDDAPPPFALRRVVRVRLPHA